MRPGAWTLRVRPDTYLNGEYHVYLPNSNLLDDDDGFIDTSSNSTITLFGTGENILTVGTYDNRYDSLWIGSSVGPTRGVSAKPDFVAPGINVVSTYGNNSYVSGTGAGISSSVTSGILALTMQYLSRQSSNPKLLLYSQVLKTYLMIGATRNELFYYPNDSQGYGVIDFRRTIQIISDSL